MLTLRFLANLAEGALRLALIDLTYYCKSYQLQIGVPNTSIMGTFFFFVVFYVKERAPTSFPKNVFSEYRLLS